MGIDLLVNKLQLQFDEVIELPDLPDQLTHLYDLTKLSAAKIIAERKIPFCHQDYDCWLRKPLPNNLLTSDFFCEHSYPTKKSVFQHHQLLPVKLFDSIPEKSCATGIYGGNDLKTILNYSNKSIEIAIHPDNRNLLCSLNGYDSSVIFGETAAGKAFENRITTLFPDGMNDEEFRKKGYLHAAGRLKDDPGQQAKIAIRLDLDFPEEYRKVGKLFDSI
jgi:hypothetical protein